MLATRLFRHFRRTLVPRSTSIIKVARIATMSKDLNTASLTQLYRDGVLKASTETDLPEPNQKLNDKIYILRETDITKLKVDAIVNAANTWLLGGGGVDGAIHAAAGPGLKEECRALNGCATGDAKMTDGHNLPAKHVIHAVGPVYTKKMGDKNEELLASCYYKSMQLALDKGCKTIAFPCISTGVYDYPGDDASCVALDTVGEFLLGEVVEMVDKEEEVVNKKGEKVTKVVKEEKSITILDKFDKIILCTFLVKDAEFYKKNAPLYFPPTDEDKAVAEKNAKVKAKKEAAAKKKNPTDGDAAAEEKPAEGEEK